MSHARLESEKLIVRIHDNAPDQGRYSGSHGVSSLIHRDQGREVVLPGWSVLGLETIALSGLPPQEEIVGNREPRSCPMTLETLDERTVRLHQPATLHLSVETEITYRLSDAETLDLETVYRFHRTDPTLGGFTALWVGRMNGPADRRLYFPGHTADDTRPRWLRLSAASHTAARSVTDADAAGPEDRERFAWGAPFYYGLVDGYAWIAMFLSPAVTGLAYSPTAGFASAVPACGWNFFHRIPQVRPGISYSVRQRFTYTRFVGRQAVAREFERQTGQSLSVDLAAVR